MDDKTYTKHLVFNFEKCALFLRADNEGKKPHDDDDHSSPSGENKINLFSLLLLLVRTT